jgi:hypothetical protein
VLSPANITILKEKAHINALVVEMNYSALKPSTIPAQAGRASTSLFRRKKSKKRQTGASSWSGQKCFAANVMHISAMSSTMARDRLASVIVLTPQHSPLHKKKKSSISPNLKTTLIELYPQLA